VPAARLPENGPVRLGSLQLPEGYRTHVRGSRDGSTPPVAWVTIKPVPDAGAVWAELSLMSAQTGLVPFIARTQYGDRRRPWDDGTHRHRDFFQDPVDPAVADQIDLAAALRDNWEELAEFPGDDPGEDGWRNREHARMIAPFFSGFPGLAPDCAEPLSPEQIRAALDRLPPSRIGLAVADRPADALAAMGWLAGNWFEGIDQITAALRSWEDRFGARLLAVGHDEFKLLAERRPRDRSAAQHVAAELRALTADEFTCAWEEEALIDVNDIADSVLRSPIWGFWWD
jgi:hypothetical protein